MLGLRLSFRIPKQCQRHSQGLVAKLADFVVASGS